jgi:UDP-N-acetylmuramoyl-tripeptide--D-alanyl-D-alanine ligase
MLSAAARELQAELIGADARFTGCSTDSRSINAGELFIALRGPRHDGHAFIGQAKDKGAAAAMVDTETLFALPLLRVADTRSALGRLAGYWRRQFNPRIVAVTGSNGKTTVKEMVANILALQAPVLATRGNFNNDIGVPLTLFNIGPEHRYAVIEMGANHPGEIAYLSALVRPEIAAITQCAPAHLEGFGSMAGVAEAKAEIFGGLSENGVAVINADDAYASFWRGRTTGLRQISFGLTHPADVTAVHIRIEAGSGGAAFRLVTAQGEVDVALALPGRHNVQNALAAAACTLGLDIPIGLIKAGLECTRGSKGRLQMKKGIAGACIIDDTYNANPVSLEAAMTLVAGRAGRRWLALGDMGELGEAAASLHWQAGERARELGFERLYALGRHCGSAVDGFGSGARLYTSVESMIGALRGELAQDVTLLVKGSRAMGMETVVNALIEAQS